MGGALATIAAGFLADNGFWGHILGIHTFGAPKVGGSEFATAFINSFQGRYFRFVNHSDIVARYPMAPQYSHACEPLYIDHQGKLQERTSVANRLLNRFHASSKPTSNPSVSVSVPIDSLGDHLIEEYVRIMEGLVEEKVKEAAKKISPLEKSQSATMINM